MDDVFNLHVKINEAAGLDRLETVGFIGKNKTPE